MTENLEPRNYNLRYKGKCQKFPMDSYFSVYPPADKCKNCITLLSEIDYLRRQNAILTKLCQDSPNKINIPFNDSDSILISDNVSLMQESGAQTSASNVESIETEPRSLRSVSSQASTECAEQICGPDIQISDDDNHQTSAICTVDEKAVQAYNDCVEKTSGPDGYITGKDSNDRYDLCCGTDDTSIITTINGTDQIVRPYNVHSQGLFSEFDVSRLHKSTAFSHKFSNRSVAYYGQHPYKYAGGEHHPHPLTENSYLSVILESVKKHHPAFSYNSVMITSYSCGNDWIPFHSDDENSIKPGSSIMTISLGASRKFEFKSKSVNNPVETSLILDHGDSLTMTHLSQSFFKHGVPKDPSSNQMRISITLRDLSSSNCSATEEKVEQNLVSGKSSTVYISSSMFSSFDSERLSSRHQEAHVFAYPGATADMILKRFKADERRLKLDGTKVDTIILLCGSNDIDSILNSPRHCRNELLTYGKFSQNARALDKTNNSIENLVLFLHQWANAANLKIVNLLPRESSSRNEVISNVNQFISKLPERHSFLTMISTEKDRYLFVDKYGFRKSCYFSVKGDDNIHLNTDGVIKLARHLKYHAHL